MSTKFNVALVNERGVYFAVVAVKRYTLNDKEECNRLIRTMRRSLGCPNIVLMERDNSGRATYYGRTDIVRFLSTQFVEALPWREATIG